MVKPRKKREMLMSKPKIERFRVLSVDDDGTVQLENLDMVKRGVHHATIWAITENDLVEGSTVKGSIDGDPGDSLLFGFPVFMLAD